VIGDEGGQNGQLPKALEEILSVKLASGSGAKVEQI
jgi:hypothetical protein